MSRKSNEGSVSISRRGKTMQVKPEQIKAGDIICARNPEGKPELMRNRAGRELADADA